MEFENTNLDSDRQLELASQALTKLIQNQTKIKPNRQKLLIKMKPLIAEARQAGVSYLKIVQTLTDQGLRITRHDLVEFCRRELGETPKRRIKNK